MSTTKPAAPTPQPERPRKIWNWGPTRTKQSFKDECDINLIMSKWTKTGEVHHAQSAEPQYGDFSNVGTYHEALNNVLEAKRDFMELSAKVRTRFGNDPAQLISFMEDPNNYDEAVELQIIRPETHDDPPEAKIVPKPSEPVPPADD